MMRFTPIPVLLAALWIAGCSDQQSAERLLGPGEMQNAASGQLRRLAVDVPAAEQGTASAVFATNGGLLSVTSATDDGLRYYLYVPGGAVKKPTTFTMSVAADGLVSLTATRVVRGETVDVGAAGFDRPVLLAMHYGHATEPIEDPEQLRVSWVQADGALVAVSSSVSTRFEMVYGSLHHFSDYAVAVPN